MRRNPLMAAPTARHRGQRLRAVIALTALTLAACHDTPGTDGTAPAPSTQRTARLVVEPAVVGDSVLTVAVRVSRVAEQRVGSMTAAVLYDTTRLRYLDDASPTDGAVRAAHAAGGRVLVATAHPLGFDDETVARVRFVSRDSAAWRSFVLQVRELHLLDAADARRTLQTLPVEVIR